MTANREHPAEKTDRLRLSPAVAAAAATLAGAGVGPARAEAELLAAAVLGVSRGRLALIARFTPGQRDRYDELVGRRARRVPVQHLLGQAGFRHLSLAVGPGVFIPRPETELVAGWGIDRARPMTAPRVVDLCAGSGAIALSVAHEVPHARVVAVENSPTALGWLRRNAADRAAAGDPPVTVVAADATDPGLLAALRGRVDVLLTNPPYVPAGTPVAPEVAEHDPAQAVFSGPDGLATIRPLIVRAAELLRPGGVLAVEHHDTHGDLVPDLLRADGRFVDVAAHQDLAGRARFATATRGTRGPEAWQTGNP